MLDRCLPGLSIAQWTVDAMLGRLRGAKTDKTHRELLAEARYAQAIKLATLLVSTPNSGWDRGTPQQALDDAERLCWTAWRYRVGRLHDGTPR